MNRPGHTESGARPADEAVSAGAGPIVAKHGGQLVARGTGIEGLAGHHNWTVGAVLRFPNPAAVHAWYNDPDYQRIVPIRTQWLTRTWRSQFSRNRGSPAACHPGWSGWGYGMSVALKFTAEGERAARRLRLERRLRHILGDGSRIRPDRHCHDPDDGRQSRAAEPASGCRA
ncbi:MAG: DUF1330 domain-containing protein [Candidatus Binataceae bacterium]